MVILDQWQLFLKTEFMIVCSSALFAVQTRTSLVRVTGWEVLRGVFGFFLLPCFIGFCEILGGTSKPPCPLPVRGQRQVTGSLLSLRLLFFSPTGQTGHKWSFLIFLLLTEAGFWRKPLPMFHPNPTLYCK